MSFSIPLSAIAEKTKVELATVVRKATADIFAAVVQKTPVDSGRFRANWNVSYGQVNYSTSAATDKSRADAEVRKALSFDAGSIVYMTNSLPYGYRLEYEGWSKQAPAGMLRTTVAEYDQYVRKALK